MAMRKEPRAFCVRGRTIESRDLSNSPLAFALPTAKGCLMSQYRYVISAVSAGWTITCNGVSGPPYPERGAAVLDTLAAADRMRAHGHQCEVRLIDLDGIGLILKSEDAKLFT